MELVMKRTTNDFLKWMNLEVGNKIMVYADILDGYEIFTVGMIDNVACLQPALKDESLKNINYLFDKKYEIIQDPLLEEEKKYLKTFLKPFKNEILFIQKICADARHEYLKIVMKHDSVSLPWYKRGKYYTNLYYDKKYTLDDLGLDWSDDIEL